MPSMTEITCACGCGRKKMVRVADIRRGWGKYFSKSCKAKHQEKRTGQYRKYLKKGTVEVGDFGEPLFSGHNFSNEEWVDSKD